MNGRELQRDALEGRTGDGTIPISGLGLVQAGISGRRQAARVVVALAADVIDEHQLAGQSTGSGDRDADGNGAQRGQPQLRVGRRREAEVSQEFAASRAAAGSALQRRHTKRKN